MSESILCCERVWNALFMLIFLRNCSTLLSIIVHYTHIDIVEAAPFNVGHYGKYKGVGAHLFAIACKLSFENGNEGYVQFTAKTNLVSHYIQMLNAKSIDRHTLYTESKDAATLVKRYF